MCMYVYDFFQAAYCEFDQVKILKLMGDDLTNEFPNISRWMTRMEQLPYTTLPL